MTLLHTLGRLAAGLGLSALLMVAPAVHAQTPRGDGGTVRMLINPAGTMSIPPAVIKKFGLDKKYGINIEIVPYSNQSAAAVALQGKSTEIVVLDWLATARLKASGIPVVGVAPFLTYVNSVLVPKDSQIKTLSDLRGKKIGVPNKTGFDWIIMLAAAKKSLKIDLGKEVQLQEGAIPLLRGLAEKGDLEALQMWNSLAPEMLASGQFRTLMTIRQVAEQMGLPTVPFLFFGMREDYAKERPANVRAFVAAYQEAADIMLSNDEIWVEQGTRMKMSPEALSFFKAQVRRDLLKKFSPEMAPGLEATFAALIDVAGAETLGMKQMPAGLLTMDYQ